MKGHEFAGRHLKIECKQLFNKDAKKFIKLYFKKHLKLSESLNQKIFQKIAPDVSYFVKKYAADSGEIESCS